MLDLLNIAKTEADGNDLLKLISSLYKASDIRPKGYSNAIVWEGGNFNKNIKPIAHSTKYIKSLPLTSSKRSFLRN